MLLLSVDNVGKYRKNFWGDKDFVIYEYIPARGSKEFKLKADWPPGAKSCGWDVVTATGYKRKLQVA